jgi:deazaflavin-dependent oxidoreductase (nitroreductase family)
VSGQLPNVMRLGTKLGRPIGLRRAGKAGSGTSIVRHVGRKSGHSYETPVVAVKHDDDFLIALPYGQRSDWLNNVFAKDGADIVMDGHVYQVEHPEVIPMDEATVFFTGKQQRLHRMFGLESAVRLHQSPRPRAA